MKIVILLLILLKHASTNNVWVIEQAVSSSSSSSLPPSSIENQIEQTQQEIEEKVEDYDESFIPKKKFACSTLALDWHFHFSFDLEMYESIICCIRIHFFHPPSYKSFFLVCLWKYSIPKINLTQFEWYLFKEFKIFLKQIWFFFKRIHHIYKHD